MKIIIFLILITYSCNNTKQELTPIEQAYQLDKRIGGQRELIKSMYETEISQLRQENLILKQAIIRKDSIIDRCMTLSNMVIEHISNE